MDKGDSSEGKGKKERASENPELDSLKKENKIFGVLDWSTKNEMERFIHESDKQKAKIYPDLILNDSQVHDLLWRYGVKEKKSVDDVVLDEELEEQRPSEQKLPIPDEDISKKIDYSSLREDMKRLESYENLSKMYDLTKEQLGSAFAAYNRIQEASSTLSEMEETYKPISDKAKEIADLSGQVLKKLRGNSYMDEDPSKWYM